MYSKAIFTFCFAMTLSLLAAAMPADLVARGGCLPGPTQTVTVTAPASAPTGGSSSCTSGPIQCCNTTTKAADPVGNLLLGLLGIVVDGIDVLLGIDCSPISVVGVGSGNTCTANVVCCENNNVGGLISIGCIPIIL